MSRTVEQILRDQVGGLVMQVCALMAELEQLKEQLALATSKLPIEPPTIPPT